MKMELKKLDSQNVVGARIILESEESDIAECDKMMQEMGFSIVNKIRLENCSVLCIYASSSIEDAIVYLKQ